MGEAYRTRRIAELIVRWRPAALSEKWGVRCIETGQLVEGAEYGSEDLARVKCRMLAAAEIERLYIGDQAAAVQRILTILGEQTDPRWAAERIFEYFQGVRA